MATIPPTNPPSFQQQKQAWIAISGLVLFLALSFGVGAGRFLIVLFPLSSFAIGILLYLRSPTLYVGFTYWMWFLGGLIRRLIDYQSGYITPGPFLFAPSLVTLVSGATLVRHLPRSCRQGGLPFILCLSSILYGLLIDLIQNPVRDFYIVKAVLDAICPVIFGFHLFINWQDYPDHRKIIQRTFLFGVLVMGAYGIWQFLVAPEWDRFWLIVTEKESRGKPEPFQIRVWSTMEASQGFASTMMAGLLLLFCGRGGLLRFSAMGVGYVAFLLSRARAGWISWLVGLVAFISLQKLKHQIRTVVSIAIGVIIVVPLIFYEPIYENVSQRVETLSNVQEDRSLEARSAGYNYLLGQAIAEPLGKGLRFSDTVETGQTGYSLSDGAILPLLFSLGWFGALPYLGGVIALLLKLLSERANSLDLFDGAIKAITIGLFSQMFFNNILVGSLGIVFWSFLSLGLAARRYYSYQRIVESHYFQEYPP